MKFQIRDIELLRIIAACKDIPCILPYDDEAFSEDYLASLPYVRHSKCGNTFRRTDEGYAFLDSLGFRAEPDQRPVGKGTTMERRIRSALAVVLMYRAGVDVFSRRVPFFLPAFLCRRERGKGSVLGNSTLLGLLVCETIAYAVISDRPDPLNLEHELDAARRFALANGVSGGIEPIILIGRGLIYNWDFRSSAYLVGYNDTGATQIRILTEPDYHERLLENFLVCGELKRAPSLCIDGINEDGIAVRFSPECNITKIMEFALDAERLGLPCQLTAYDETYKILNRLYNGHLSRQVTKKVFCDPMYSLRLLGIQQPYYTPEEGIFHA